MVDIIPISVAGSHKTGELSNISIEEINEILGFEPNCEDDPDKVKASWGFEVGGENFGVWSYKGSELHGVFSTYGSFDVFVELFGERYQ